MGYNTEAYPYEFLFYCGTKVGIGFLDLTWPLAALIALHAMSWSRPVVSGSTKDCCQLMVLTWRSLFSIFLTVFALGSMAL